MTNGPKTDILHHHYSADEFYLLPILLTATCIHMFILFMTIWSSIILKTRHLYHATYKLFLMTVFVHVSNSIHFSSAGTILVHRKSWAWGIRKSRKMSISLSNPTLEDLKMKFL